MIKLDTEIDDPYAIYDRSDPMRPEDWRLRRSNQIIKSGIGPDEYDDRWVIRRTEYMRARNELYNVGSPCTAKLHRGVRKLSADYKEIHHASRINEMNERTGKWLLEAMLSVPYTSIEQSVNTTADRIGLTRNVVYAYSQLFFDVAGRMNTLFWSRGIFLAQLLTRGVGEMDMDVMWKATAYFYGLDFLLHLASIEHLPDDVKIKFDKMLRSQVLRRALVGVVCRAPGAYNTVEMLQAHAALTEHTPLEIEEDDGTAARALLSRVTYSVQAVVGVKPTTERRELRSGVEMSRLLAQEASK